MEVTKPKKRGRGRPKKIKTEVQQPEVKKRKRGRPPKPKQPEIKPENIIINKPNPIKRTGRPKLEPKYILPKYKFNDIVGIKWLGNYYQGMVMSEIIFNEDIKIFEYKIMVVDRSEKGYTIYPCMVPYHEELAKKLKKPGYIIKKYDI